MDEVFGREEPAESAAPAEDSGDVYDDMPDEEES